MNVNKILNKDHNVLPADQFPVTQVKTKSSPGSSLPLTLAGKHSNLC